MKSLRNTESVKGNGKIVLSVVLAIFQPYDSDYGMCTCEERMSYCFNASVNIWLSVVLAIFQPYGGPEYNYFIMAPFTVSFGPVSCGQHVLLGMSKRASDVSFHP